MMLLKTSLPNTPKLALSIQNSRVTQRYKSRNMENEPMVLFLQECIQMRLKWKYKNTL